MADDTSQGRARKGRRVRQPPVSPDPSGERCPGHNDEVDKWAGYHKRLRIRLLYWPQALFFALLFAAVLSTTGSLGAALLKGVEASLAPSLFLFLWAAASLVIFLFVVADTFLKFGVAQSLIAQVRSDLRKCVTCRKCVARLREADEAKVLKIIHMIEDGADITFARKQL